MIVYQIFSFLKNAQKDCIEKDIIMLQWITTKVSIGHFEQPSFGQNGCRDWKIRSVGQMNIYVGNVKYEMTESQLKEMFSAYG